MNQEPAGAAVVETRSVVVDGVRQAYRVAGEGPVCLVHSGGPGVHPEYLRLPGLEGRLTMVYVGPAGCCSVSRTLGHFGHIEQADAFAAAVPDFVQEQKKGNGE